MDTNQPTTTTVYVQPAPATGMFGSKVPSSVAFIVAILLFFMPFVDIKCNGTSLQTISGVQLATGFQMKNNSSDNSFLNDVKTETVDKNITKATTKTDKKEPNLYAMIALGLGVLGLILSFTNVKVALGIALVAGIGAAAGLVAMMFDIKNKAKLEMPNLKDKTPDNDVGNTVDKIGDKVSSLTDNIKITVDFTPWFYIAVIGFLLGAFFCYRRMSNRQANIITPNQNLNNG